MKKARGLNYILTFEKFLILRQLSYHVNDCCCYWYGASPVTVKWSRGCLSLLVWTLFLVIINQKCLLFDKNGQCLTPPKANSSRIFLNPYISTKYMSQRQHLTHPLNPSMSIWSLKFVGTSICIEPKLKSWTGIGSNTGTKIWNGPNWRGIGSNTMLRKMDRA